MHKLIMGLAIAGMVLIFLFKLNVISQSGETYVITVPSYSGEASSTYMTKHYSKHKTGCISFKDELGINRIVCGPYTISSFNLDK